MRVTQKMMSDQTTANLSAAAERLLRLQSQMSTSRRLGRPSDDPIGITRDLSYRTLISEVGQYRANISSATTHLDTFDQSLDTAGNLLITARELATSLANDTYDDTARRSAAEEAKSLLEQMLQAGNTQKEGRYIFSGHQTRTQTFLATPNGVVYQGDHGLINAQVEASSQVAVNLIGSDVFLAPLQVLGEKFDLNRGVTPVVSLADLRHGAGIDQTPGLARFTDDNTGTSVMVDLSAAATVGDVITAINAQLTAGGMSGVTASVSPSGNAVRLTAADNGLISAATKLANINRASSIDLVPGVIRVATDDLTVDVNVDLSGATTVGDVVSTFNAQMTAAGVANVTMSLNGSGTGFQIDDTNGAPLGLQVIDPTGESTAQGLGIRGYVNAQLVGGPLNPVRSISVTENVPGETTASDLGILGSFKNTMDGGDLDPILKTTTPLAELFSVHGVSLGRIRIAQGSTFAVVDLSTAVTVDDVISRINSSGLQVQASLNADARGIQVVPTTSDQSLIITDEAAGGGAVTLGIKGSPDLLGNMMLLSESLLKNDREMVGNLIGGLEKAANRILDSRAAVGAKIRRMDSTGSRLEAISLSATRLLSEVEDADIIKVTTELATQQNVYQAALNAAARILSPSLIDFVR